MLVIVLLKSVWTPVHECGLQNCRAGISVFIYIFIFGNIRSHILIGFIPSRDLSLECYNCSVGLTYWNNLVLFFQILCCACLLRLWLY